MNNEMKYIYASLRHALDTGDSLWLHAGDVRELCDFIADSAMLRVQIDNAISILSEKADALGEAIGEEDKNG